jgi:predicted ATPase
VSEGVDPKEYREQHGQEYQDAVIETDLLVQSNIPDDETVFMDRSVVDNIAYANLTDRSVPDKLHERCRDVYDLVFRLDRIEYEEDYARTEDEKMSKEIHDELRDVYEQLGYTVIDVPLMPVDERADFIERKINRTAIH